MLKGVLKFLFPSWYQNTSLSRKSSPVASSFVAFIPRLSQSTHLDKAHWNNPYTPFYLSKINIPAPTSKEPPIAKGQDGKLKPGI